VLFVPDTTVLITAAISPSGGAGKLLHYAREGRIEIALSPKLHYELESRLLTRERFRRYLTVDDAQIYVDALAALGTWFDDRPDDELPQICRDPDDNFVIALYQDTEAAMLVSNDRDILDLKYPNLIVGNPGRALAAIDYQHEWGNQFIPGVFEESLLQVDAEGSSQIFAAYVAFKEIVDERAMDVLPFIVVPGTHQAFVDGFEEMRTMLANRGLGTRPHFIAPEVAYLKLPPNPGINLQVTGGDAALPKDTILVTMQHCPDVEDPPGADLGNWRVFGIGPWPLDQIPPRPQPQPPPTIV
jgi:putative PIN family toxin of toxin-antitoxin system